MIPIERKMTLWYASRTSKYSTNFWWVTTFSCQVHSKLKTNSQPTVEILIRNNTTTYHQENNYSAFLTRSRFRSLGALIVGKNKCDRLQTKYSLLLQSDHSQYRSKVSWQSQPKTRISILDDFENQVSSFRARVSSVKFENWVSRG